MDASIIPDVGTGKHIDLLVNCLEAMDRNPQWFDAEVLPAASDFCNSELAAIERDLLAQNENAARHGDVIVERRKNLIIPIVPAWQAEGNPPSQYSPN